MNNSEKVMIFGTGSDEIIDLYAFGSTLSTTVLAFIVGSQQDADAVAACGVSEVYWLDANSDRLFEDHQETLRVLVEQVQPALVLMKANKRLRLAAGRLAAACKTSVITDVSRAWIEDGAVFGEHMVFGGGGIRVEKTTTSPAIMLVSESGCGVNVDAGDTPAASPASVKPVDFIEGTTAIRLVDRRARQVESVNLPCAKRVVSVGRGFEAETDLTMAYDLARALEAEVGCTRPIAEASRWMSRERYIGVSGSMLKPDLFLAVGVSGQIQHMVGATRAKTIMAINKDKNAPIFKQADYGLVGNLYEALPKIIEKLNS
jgi:electron transfer flavoprotein alpha subunit